MSAAFGPGRIFDRYRLLEKLGEGGMGVVWLAEDTRLGRKVALKFLPPDAARDTSRRQRLEQEARAAAALSHAGVATVHELAESEGQTYIVFEYVPGKTLRNRVAPGGLERDELLDIAGDIADALAAAHTAGVVHRDLKPENVIRTPAGHCKVLDFGVARFSAEVTPDSATETRSRLTGAGMVVGTVAYMAPEQLEGKEVDFRSDIFSFGTLVYELATGVHPFQGGSSASTIAAIMTTEPSPITGRNRLQPPELDRIVRKCLRKRREERYQSTLDLAVDIANLKRDSGERSSGVTAIATPALPDDNDSLLRKIFASLGATPRRWWELYQLFGIFVYAPVAYSLALNGSASIGSAYGIALTSLSRGWRGLMQDITSGLPISSSIWMNLGLAFLVSVVLLLTTTVATRLYLIWLAIFIPERLLMDVCKIQTVLRVVYTILACQLAFVGFSVLKVGNLILGIELVAFGLGTLLAVSYAEPEMVRAAFPKAFAEPKPRRGRWKWAAVGIVGFAICLAAAELFYLRFLGGPANAIDSIAVLPFTNASGDPNTEYLSDGITESLINSLSQLPSLRVMSRNSVFRYKGQPTDAQAAGHELGVRAVLTGRVVQRGDNLSISTELVDARDNSHLWGDQYNRRLADLLSLQEDISKEVTEKLRLRLTGEQKEALTKRFTQNTEAYQLYLKGRYYWDKRTADGFNSGITYFQQAIEKDPNYALAYAGLADCYNLLGAFGYVPPREAYPKGEAAATKALELDEKLAEPHASLAYAKVFYDWDWPAAHREFERALELNPNYATAHAWYAWYYFAMGRPDDAVREKKRALELDPLSLIINAELGWALIFQRQYDQAIEQERKTLEMDPNFRGAHEVLGRAYLQEARYAEAITEAQKASNGFVLARAYFKTDTIRKAQKVVDDLKDLSKTRYVPAYEMALAYIGLDDKERAFEWLLKAYEERSLKPNFMRLDPAFDDLRPDPRFQDLMGRVGLPP